MLVSCKKNTEPQEGTGVNSYWNESRSKHHLSNLFTIYLFINSFDKTILLLLEYGKIVATRRLSDHLTPNTRLRDDVFKNIQCTNIQHFCFHFIFHKKLSTIFYILTGSSSSSSSSCSSSTVAFVEQIHLLDIQYTRTFSLPYCYLGNKVY